MKRSCYILGRTANRTAWEKAFRERGSFTVGAFDTVRGTMYANATDTPSKKSSVRYRVRVTPKAPLRKVIPRDWLLHHWKLTRA